MMELWDIGKYESFFRFVETNENTVRSTHFIKLNGINFLLTASYQLL